MSPSHMMLISITTDLMAGVTRLEKIIAELKQMGEIAAVSSIYKKYLNQRSEDLNSELVMVLKLEAEKEFEVVFQFLRRIEKQYQSGSSTTALILLSFDQSIRLFPGQNLPSPLLHMDPLTLRCASEAWGSYEHPVLGQTLNELVRSQKPLAHVEFFAQGRSLFSSELL